MTHRFIPVLFTLALTAGLAGCGRSHAETPLARLRSARARSLRAMDLPLARSARTPTPAPHVRVVITETGIDVDVSELITDRDATLENAVTFAAAHRQGASVRDDELRGGASGFLIVPLQRALEQRAARFASTPASRASVPVLLYAARSTPSGLVYRALYTIGASGFTTMQFAMRRGETVVQTPIAAPRSEELERMQASDCVELTLECAESTVILRQTSVRAGTRSATTAVSQRALAAAEAALAAFEGRDAAVTAEAPPEERRTTFASSGDLRETVATALRAASADAGVGLCNPLVMQVRASIEYGAAVELRETIVSELGWSAPILSTTP